MANKVFIIGLGNWPNYWHLLKNWNPDFIFGLPFGPWKLKGREGTKGFFQRNLLVV